MKKMDALFEYFLKEERFTQIYFTEDSLCFINVYEKESNLKDINLSVKGLPKIKKEEIIYIAKRFGEYLKIKIDENQPVISKVTDLGVIFITDIPKYNLTFRKNYKK